MPWHRTVRRSRLRWGRASALVLGASIATACGGGDDASADAGPPGCTVTLSGDVTATESCRPFLCYPVGEDYEAILIAKPVESTLTYSAAPSIAAPATFAVGTYTLDDLDGPLTEFRVLHEGTTYRARTRADRHPDEQVNMTIDQVSGSPVVADDPCSGLFRGTIAATMVEFDDDGVADDSMVQGGRVQLTVTVE